MIKKEEVFAAGSVNKPHGIAGELSVSFAAPLVVEKGLPFLLLEIDGILTPFPVAHCRWRTEVSAFVQLEGIDTDVKAKSLSHKTIYLPLQYRKEQTSEELGLRYFVGFRVVDAAQGELGAIEDVEDSTANVLFVVGEHLIPATDDYIMRIDEAERVIYMNLPDGLLD